MRLLVDANLSPRVARRLPDNGHDVVHVFDIGLRSATDPVILARADEAERVIVSSDRDFGALLARHERATPSLVLLRHSNDLRPDQQADLLIAGLPTGEDELGAGAVVTFARRRIRVRRLPFTRP